MTGDIVRELCALPGVSGCEDAVRDYISRRIAPYAEEMHTDAMGSLIAFVRGRRGAPKCGKIMLAAHMDEVGVIVTDVGDDGFLRFDFVGGVDRRVAMGKRVTLYGRQTVRGVIGLKPIHLTEGDEKKRIPKLSELYIDIGCADGESARRLVSPGDVGCFDGTPVMFGDGFLRAKAIDDRVGCAVMISLIESGVPVDAWFAFTVQEEVGCRGAAAAAWKIGADTAIVLEGTTAADLPSLKGAQRVCAPGRGPVIPFMDGGTIYDRALFETLTALADEKGIPWQTKTRIAGGTDASAIQRTASGTHVAAISAAVRYIHSPSCVGCMRDFEDMERLAGAYLETL